MDPEPPFPSRRSIRLKGFDYSQAGLYFITICTHNRSCLFGEIQDGAMRLNDTGRIVSECWLEIPRHFPGVQLDAFVVMPNHIHCVVVILPQVGHAISGQHAAAIGEAFAKPVAGSLATIVRSFKAEVTRRVRAMQGPAAQQVWQRSYYERVIRTGKEFREVTQYIAENPKVWEFDEENPTRQKR